MRSLILSSFVVMAIAGCADTPADDHLDVVFDVCAPVAVVAPGASADQLAGIERGLELWRAVGVSGPVLGSVAGAPELEIRFQTAALNFHGLYEDELGVIFVNDRLTDPAQRAVTIAHELGHAFGLWHVPTSERPSLMNPGNLTILPTEADVAALTALWGTCSPPDPAAAVAAR